MTSDNKKRYLNKLTYDLPNEEYHGPNFKWAFSSTQFKDVEDEEYFIERHIKRTIAKEESPAFDVGTYFHVGTLEPHKLKMECTVYPGKVRRGNNWEQFLKKNKGKAIVTQQQKDQALGLVRAVKESRVAQTYLKGKPEVSLFVELNVYDGKIYAPYYGKELTANGWVKNLQKRIDGAFVIYVKTRADLLGKTFITDLKSTSGDARSFKAMRNTISEYTYDLSCALYLDMFNLYLDGALEKFIWIFASKKYLTAKAWEASPTQIKVGRAKYMKAMIHMAKLAANDWKYVDTLDTLEPLPFELEHLKTRDIDLI